MGRNWLVFVLGLGLLASLALWKGSAQGGSDGAAIRARGSSAELEQSAAAAAPPVDSIALAARTLDRNLIAMRLAQPDGSSTELAGDGLLYVRPLGVPVSKPATTFPIQGGLVDLGAWELDQVEPIAAQIDGQALRPAEDEQLPPAEQAARTLAWAPFSGYLIEVLDPDGKAATLAEARISTLPSVSLGEDHPGAPMAGFGLRQEHGSPLLIGHQELRTPERTVYLRSNFSRWGRLALNPASPTCCTVALADGGDLRVDCGPPRGIDGLALRLEGPAIGVIQWRPLVDRVTLVPGLAPGPVTVLLGAPDCTPEQAIHVGHAQIQAGQVAELQLFTPGEHVLATGLFTGSLQLPDLDHAELDEIRDSLVLKLTHEQAHGQAASMVPLGDLQGIKLDRMAADGTGGRRWLWQSKDLPAGGYRLTLMPLGLQQEAWLEPGMTAQVDLEVPALARGLVRFEDPSGAPIESLQISMVQQLSAAFGSLRAEAIWWHWDQDMDPGLRVLAAPGSILVTVSDDRLGVTSHEIVLPAGPSEHLIHAEPATWIELDLQGPEGPIAPPDEWWQGLELTSGGVPLQTLSRSFPFTIGEPIPEGASKSCHICVAGSEEVTILMPPLDPFGPLAPVTVPAGGSSTRRPFTIRIPGD